MIPFTLLSISHSTCRILGFIAWVLSKVNLHFHGTACYYYTSSVDNTEKRKKIKIRKAVEETKK